MHELSEILRPSWGAEKWILEGWNTLQDHEKQHITDRIEALFCDGLPFELKSDKLFYIYTFSLLAQLEVLAIQVPLKFEAKMSSPEHQKRMRQQLLDEVFHGLVFTKIVYMLCSPYASPPPYSPNIEVLCNFIRNEESPKVAIMLLNLIGEGWIEEIFYSLHKFDIAPKVFTTILEDEHRHVCEADLYRDIGLPTTSEVKPKIAYLEEQLLANIFMQYKYMFSVCALLGVEGVNDFKQSLNKKHTEQLKKINLQPSEKWHFFMQFADVLIPKVKNYADSSQAVEMTPIRKVFMTQWDNPSDPTMVGQFNMNISCIDFFNKKFPPETVTCLMMQAISLTLSLHDSFRNYLSFRQIFQSKESYVGLVVRLPDCGDHLGTIVFENCHKLNLVELSAKIKTIMNMMVYCYKKRDYLEKNNVRVQQTMSEMLYDFAYNTYSSPIAGTPFVSLSNIGFCGYSQSLSPLRCNEAIKFTLMEVERKPIWDNNKQSFQPQDILPVSISADHRIFDGNLPVPKMVADGFKIMFNKLVQEKPASAKTSATQNSIETLLDRLIENNVEIGYKALLLMQTYWFDFISIEEIYSAMNENEQLVIPV